MGEKLCLNVPFWSISKILKRVAATLTQLHVREEKTHGFLPFLFENIYHFIDLNTSLSYIRMVMGEKLCSGLILTILGQWPIPLELGILARKRPKLGIF